MSKPHPHTAKQYGDAGGIFPHEGDCLGSLCPVCGCCLHCGDDCGCEGCVDEYCICNEENRETK